jgi:hypothetical protein
MRHILFPFKLPLNVKIKKWFFIVQIHFFSIKVLFQEKGEILVPAEIPIFEVQLIYAIFFLMVFENEGKAFD